VVEIGGACSTHRVQNGEPAVHSDDNIKTDLTETIWEGVKAGFIWLGGCCCVHGSACSRSMNAGNSFTS
jgi:hypothetical protein